MHSEKAQGLPAMGLSETWLESVTIGTQAPASPAQKHWSAVIPSNRSGTAGNRLSRCGIQKAGRPQQSEFLDFLRFPYPKPTGARHPLGSWRQSMPKAENLPAENHSLALSIGPPGCLGPIS